MSQWVATLPIIAKHRAHGITPSMITLALTPMKSPKMVADVIARMKIGVWNLSPSWRLYAKDEIEHPRTRHANSINAAGGSRIHSK